MRRGDLWLRDISVVTDDPAEEIAGVEFLLEVPGQGRVRVRVGLDTLLCKAQAALEDSCEPRRVLGVLLEVVERQA